MRQTLGQFITTVDLNIHDLTEGEVGLSDMVDFADGELALADLYDNKVNARVAAKRILRANGWEA